MALVSRLALAATWELLLVCVTKETKTRLKVLFSNILMEKFNIGQKILRLLEDPSDLVTAA